MVLHARHVRKIRQLCTRLKTIDYTLQLKMLLPPLSRGGRGCVIIAVNKFQSVGNNRLHFIYRIHISSLRDLLDNGLVIFYQYFVPMGHAVLNNKIYFMILLMLETKVSVVTPSPVGTKYW